MHSRLICRPIKLGHLLCQVSLWDDNCLMRIIAVNWNWVTVGKHRNGLVL